jgi:hypothetical protein
VAYKKFDHFCRWTPVARGRMELDSVAITDTSSSEESVPGISTEHSATITLAPKGVVTQQVVTTISSLDTTARTEIIPATVMDTRDTTGTVTVTDNSVGTKGISPVSMMDTLTTARDILITDNGTGTMTVVGTSTTTDTAIDSLETNEIIPATVSSPSTVSHATERNKVNFFYVHNTIF